MRMGTNTTFATPENFDGHDDRLGIEKGVVLPRSM